MPVREKFDEELAVLRGKLLDLGHFAEDALSLSIQALENHDIELALEIMENDKKANILYEEINDYAILLIAKQQPVAIDLRRIIVAIKIATDIERIADFAVNIAKSAIRIGKEDHVKPIVHIKQMHAICLTMLNDSLTAFNEEDLKKAKAVADMDDEVDDLYGQTIVDLLRISGEQSERIPQITQLSFVCRYLERAADHVTNISEHIFYLVKGKQFDLND
ncbi:MULTISPECIES: phosphate signaling complex protein PhoU [Cytobacillus]|uniref:phosphate signaling complex protein PhoU n=1 Tax=Cytobacillus TaxID=2675230 RepID=UPI001CD5B85D|nr:phosphate signaling complex protein PhoU [Cytobacillus kochii]MCA1025479.1 phosphate signaling complex protein PhoU [Cytobacillus kochii]MCM3320582.1 phosphate signaling complex protein PhoU [Cytobacillus kochii]MCM3344584.1 phosphate signaling complex protein PhoU [Cytobacillus kochii]MDM5208473.1 phosphate signaling complex protein PhoU [Cytobacillus kochii]